MGRRYCAFKMVFDRGIQTGAVSTIELRRCAAEMEKITDALRASGDPAAIRKATACIAR
jgi:hypothetical protein